jgi:mannose-6-phosphate isomerase-like protein (cupin superfamily)
MTLHDPQAEQARKPAMRHFLSLPTWIHADRARTGGAISLVEQHIPTGFASPWHIHQDEDESFFVIDGEVTVVVDDRRIVLGPSQYAFGPRGVPHGFRVTGPGTARLLLMTTGPRFADFIAEASEAVTAGGNAKPGEPDLARLVAAAERHGLAILGPMPD